MSAGDTYPTPHASLDLSGQVALVTGASSGLGDRFARTLAAAGAKVAVCARRADRLDRLVADIEAAGGVAVAVPLDVTDAAAITDAVDAAEEALGLVTILVNNAGMPDAQLAHKMSVEFVDTVIGTNLRGPWLLATEVARRLLAAKSPGRIVNISSMAGFHTIGSGAALYATTKAAVNRMTEALAVEWAGRHINVNAIAPGTFRSEMMDGMVERMGDFSGALPRQRFGEPSQLDSTLLYLVSPASEAVTGTVVKVDDGQLPR
ncbi:SDR family NAD(P)-dependent oxidoreductase [Nocardioides sambongensis]|uniref:SDR family NAD(P)-dependent oxidoreductase n=1 Tax=Nocardioides sambongensis TaxID=2589074 RepID=UPI00112CE750|nr:SDR family NAD(P)-dependent oxidoreductase [Nocardioides sambongensis]